MEGRCVSSCRPLVSTRLDAHVGEDGGDAIDGADELRVGGFKFGEGFLEAIESGVGVVVVGGVGEGWDIGKGTGFGAELSEELFEFESFSGWKRLCGAEALLDLRDGVLDHEGILTRRWLGVTFEIAGVFSGNSGDRFGGCLPEGEFAFNCSRAFRN